LGATSALASSVVGTMRAEHPGGLGVDDQFKYGATAALGRHLDQRRAAGARLLGQASSARALAAIILAIVAVALIIWFALGR
jgi:hypothetical protein